MSRRREDKDYKPKIRIPQSQRTPGRTKQRESVDYSEQEQDSESDTTYSESSGTVVEELPEFREALEELWTPVTLSNKISQVGEQYKRMTEQARETSMANKSDLSGMEKMMQMFLQMKRDDQMREQKREEDRLEREERRLTREGIEKGKRR